jgi:hypothetical protein
MHAQSISEKGFHAVIQSYGRHTDISIGAKCPLCESNVSSLKQLRSHLGKHQRELSLFALPSSVHDDNSEDQDSNTESDSQFGSIAPEEQTTVYHCLFWFLSCSYSSYDRSDWESHCRDHFLGEEPPRSVQCSLCDWTMTCDDGNVAWGFQAQHVADNHFKFGQGFHEARPDFHLFHYLWQKRLINDQDLKELKGMYLLEIFNTATDTSTVSPAICYPKCCGFERRIGGQFVLCRDHANQYMSIGR